jgi:capsular polysaccharide transport system permease protein
MPPEAPDAWADIIELAEVSRPTPGLSFAEPPRAAARPRRLSRAAFRFLLLVILPTLLTGSYFVLVAADRYVSEAKFVVRKPGGLGTGAAAGLSVEEGPKGFGSDDSYVVRDFMLSRDAMRLAEEKAGLRTMLARPLGDPLWRFPGMLTGWSEEHLYREYKSLVSVDYESSTGLTTLRVQAFDSGQARQIATVLIDGAETLLNGLNDRARADLLRVAEAEVERSRGAARQAQERLTEFRTRESVIDPTQLSETVLKTIASLSLQAVESAAQLDVTMQASQYSPQIAPLRARVRALQSQIDQERAVLAGGDASFAPKIAEYERLTLERDFADKSFVSALSVLESARLDAMRQQAYLERVVEAGVADDPLYPRRVIWTGSAFLGGLAIFWLFRPSAHAVPKRRRL